MTPETVDDRSSLVAPLVDPFALIAAEREQLRIWSRQAADKNQYLPYCYITHLRKVGGDCIPEEEIPETIRQTMNDQIERAFQRLLTSQTGHDIFTYGADLGTMYFHKQIFPGVFVQQFEDFVADKSISFVNGTMYESLQKLIAYCEQRNYATAWLTYTVQMKSICPSWPVTWLSTVPTASTLRIVLTELWRAADERSQHDNCRQWILNFRLLGFARHDDWLVQTALALGSSVCHPRDQSQLTQLTTKQRDAFISNATYRLLLQATNLRLDDQGLISIS